MHAVFTMPLAAKLIAGAALSALIFVYVMQYGFGLQPCVLCLWQRLPYALALIASFAALLWQPYGRQTTLLLALCALIFAVGAGLAFYHSGIERHWWAGTAGCTSQPLTANSAEDLRRQLLQTPVAHCDQITWRLFGLSMANWNVLLSLALFWFAGVAAARQNRTGI